MLDLEEQPHRRLNLLTGEWVLVSPHRTKRPWRGQVETLTPEVRPQYDPNCYLCPGNQRAGSVRNPQYKSTFVFENDFPALLPGTPQSAFDDRGLLVAEGEPGICEVVCFSPRHDLTLANMPPDDIVTVVNVWAERWQELGNKDFINYVQIFENRGAMMGASNPHPHGQIWGSSHVPNEPAREQRRFIDYRQQHATCLLCDYSQVEREKGIRIVVQNDAFVAVVPFWAVWPFETMIIARRHVTDISALETQERRALAYILHELTAIYDRVFQTPFPYTMGFHQRPTDGSAHEDWHLHAHFYPPLLRSAIVRKFMVGYEMLASPQRDITPEAAAHRLRELAPTGGAEIA